MFAEGKIPVKIGGLMTIMEMLGQSGILTVLGMGIVFSFLAILIICVTLLGKVVHALKLDKDVTDPAPAAPRPAAAPSTNNNAAVTAAISAAVNEYQKKN
jgi:oxaloacetate decarboxylase gamma subunit